MIYHYHRVANLPFPKILELYQKKVIKDNTYIEGDIQMTMDGILVFSHDPIWYGLDINTNRYDFLNQKKELPKVVDLFEFMLASRLNNVISLNLEIKTDGSLFELYKNDIIYNFLRISQRFYRGYKNSLIIQCFDVNILKVIENLRFYFNFDYVTSFLISYIKDINNINNINGYIKYISPPIEKVDKNIIEEIHKMGYFVLLWNIKDIKHIKDIEIKLTKEDGIIFDI